MEQKIKDMQLGESGYCVPWAWDGYTLNGEYTVSNRSGGTLTMTVNYDLNGCYSIWCGDREIAEYDVQVK